VLFGHVLLELFALPREVKLGNTPSMLPHTGYFWHDVQESMHAIHAFTDLIESVSRTPSGFWMSDDKQLEV
jgi:hypothetical protein